jgi:glycerophosphoryl diester phosphodiesterase
VTAFSPETAMTTKITGHRGYPRVAPENTLPSFVAATEAGAERIELDLLPSRDGILVVHHDYYLGRANDGTGPVHLQDWAELSTLDAGAWFSEAYRGTRLCRFEDVLDRFGTSIEYEVELKWAGVAFLKSAVAAVQARGLLGHVEFTSPHATVLQEVCRLCPEARRGVFLSPYPDWMEATVGEALAADTVALGGYTVAHCPGDLLTSSLMAAFQGNGVAVHVADATTPDALARAFALGVDQLSTEEVERAVALRAAIATSGVSARLV